MANYLVMGDIELESTGQSATYEFVMENYDFPPNAMDILDYMMQVGELQIIQHTWEEVDEDGVGV